MQSQLMNRDLAARLGRETLQILDDGRYIAPSGRTVALVDALKATRDGTIEYLPDATPPLPGAHARDTRFAIENATVLAVGHRMSLDGPVAALNFASATSPGGGFLSGARAQEESIARSSGLYDALKVCRMYGYHRDRLDAMYSDYVIFSPDVPVFRSDEGELLEAPWSLSIVTSPAVNGKALGRYAPERWSEVRGVMERRTSKVLAAAAHHSVRRFILGAWGCGAFGLDPHMMAGIFHEALAGPFKGVFDDIVFAITDWSEEQQFIRPFRMAFGV